MKQPRDAWARFLVVASLFVSSWAFLHSHSHAEAIPPRQRLDSFPLRVGDWTGADLAIDPEALRILGDGEFLSRSYQHPQKPDIELFIAYFPTQRTGSTIHSPQNCLPGAGWAPLEQHRARLADADWVNQYVIAKGMDRRIVIYWYQAHGRIVANEYKAKLYLIEDALQRNRSDGALVRIITSLDHDEPAGSGQERGMEFAHEILPILGQYIPL